MKLFIIFVTLIATASCAFAGIPANPVLDDPATALLIIDIQDFYYPGGAVPLTEPEIASAQASRLLAAFRARGRSIIHVGHQVASGGDFHQDVAPQNGESIVMKAEVNAFQDTNLLKILNDKGIKQLVICGMQTHMCLEGAVRAAADFGFKCIVVEDACATRDLERGGVLVKAPSVHQATLATLAGVYAEVLGTDDLLGE